MYDGWRSMMNRDYFLVMAVASVVTLLRGFAIASITTLSDFGLYATLVAMGAFGSSLLGAGAIEATMKSFPRAWARGWGLQMNERADLLAKQIAARGVFVSAAGIVAVVATDRYGWWLMVLLVIGLAVGTAMMGIYASSIRSTGNLPALSQATLYRSLLALVLAIAGAHWGGGLGAVLGEATAAILGAQIARRKALGLTRRSDVQQKESPETQILLENVKGGRWLLLGMMAASVPMYLDRPYVAGVIGIEAAGQYGFLMLFVTGAVTVAGIIVQKIGPALVHAHQAGAGVREQWHIAQTWLIGMVIVVGVGTTIAAFLLLLGPLQFLGQRYQLDTIHFILIATLGALQGVVLLDWMLLSRDQEFRVFLAAAVYVVVVGSSAMWLFLNAPTLLKVLACLIIAKLVHLSVLGAMILTLPNTHVGKNVDTHEP